METSRRTFLKGNLIGFAIWQLFYLIPFFHLDSVKWVTVLTTGLSLIGLCIWAFYLIRIVILSLHMVKRRPLTNPLNNEYFRWIRLKSFTIGFWGILASAGVLFVLSLYTTIEARLALHLLLVVAVVSPLAAYLSFDKNEVIDD
ncbi:hypothetical protein [Cohnella sp.]|uniref:hypothetical protein n=1 Tax=Cohnella sp. TaxID=1883426 RepID=UPI0035636A77